MMTWLEHIDQSLVLLINGWHTPFLDEFMWIVSGKLTWVPLYVLLVYLAIRKGGWKYGLTLLGTAVVCVALTDQISVQLFKELIQRYRPSHNIDLTERLHYYQFPNGDFYKGGQFGFISSHAANFFTVCTMSYLVLSRWFKRIWLPLLLCAVLVSFSRVYLAVHYPGDVIVGAFLGIAIAVLIYRFVFMRIIGRKSSTE